MQFLDLTLPTMAENLALDEALLDEAEASHQPRETLRLWEANTRAVVLGRSSRRAQEVNEAACLRNEVEVLRRSSGGLSIVTGPGCLMYAVVLNCLLRPELKSVPLAHQFVLGRLAAALNATTGHRRRHERFGAGDRNGQQPAHEAESSALSWNAALRFSAIARRGVSASSASFARLSGGARARIVH